jgi:creatinine amidohydrolase
LIHPHHNPNAWDEALKAAGLEGLNEIHGGMLSVCTALWLCPEYVKLNSMGSKIPEEHFKYMDFMGWERLEDGCWEQFIVGTYTKEELAEKTENFLDDLYCKKMRRFKGSFGQENRFDQVRGFCSQSVQEFLLRLN